MVRTSYRISSLAPCSAFDRIESAFIICYKFGVQQLCYKRSGVCRAGWRSERPPRTTDRWGSKRVEENLFIVSESIFWCSRVKSVNCKYSSTTFLLSAISALPGGWAKMRHSSYSAPWNLATHATVSKVANVTWNKNYFRQQRNMDVARFWTLPDVASNVVETFFETEATRQLTCLLRLNN